MGSRLVECRSEQQYAERPTALYWEGQRLEVDQIQAEWHILVGKKFRVRVRDGRLFHVIYSELDDEWQIEAV